MLVEELGFNYTVMLVIILFDELNHKLGVYVH